MGVTHTTITLGNPVKRELAPLEVSALADTGALHLCIPQHVAIQLDLQEQEKREVTLADGSRLQVPYVGPVEIHFGNRRCFVGAMVMGDEALLGAIPMVDDAGGDGQSVQPQHPFIHGKRSKTVTYRKRVAQGIGMAVMAALLAGCSEHELTMNVGPMNTFKPVRSVAIQSIIKYGDRSGNVQEFGDNCPLKDLNRCAAYYNEKYTGPGAAYAYAAQKGDSPQEATALTTHTSGNTQWLVGDALSTGVPVISSLSIVGDILIGGAHSTVHGAVAIADYNNQVQLFNAGKLFWVARYYPNHQWREGIDQASHFAIAISEGMNPAGWASATNGAHLYRIHKGWWENMSDGLFEWAWIPWVSQPKSMPAVLPIRLTWIVQPWKHSKDPYYIVNSNVSAKYPFMALATIEYRIQPGFDIPQWISAHRSQLADWMVIYHQGDKAVVWKNGHVVSYAQPTPMAIPAKLKAK